MTSLVFSKSRQTVPVLLLALAGFFTFYTYHSTGHPDLGDETQLAADMMLYMTYALNMTLGNGYVDFNGEPTLGRGPAFPLMIQWASWLLGSSVRSAFWVVRVFCIANPVLVYLLGRKMFNASVGFAAALLVLTSYSVNFWSYRHLDAVWPFFTLASVLFLYRAFELERLSYAVVSGLLCAASFLVKESAVLFLPLPIILVVVVSEFRTRKNLLHALICLGVVFGILGPWLYWTREAGIIGVNRATSILGAGLPQLSWMYFSGLIGYYGGSGGRINSLSSQFSIAPLFIVAWLFALIQFFRRSPGCKVCVVCVALLTPLAAYVVKDQLRAGQLVVLFLLNYLVLSFFLYSVAEWLSMRLLRARSWDRRRAVGYAFTLLVVPVILFQFFVHHEQDKGGGAFLERSYFVHRFREWKSDDSGRRTLSPPSWRAKGYSFALRDVVTWFEKHATPDALILVGDGGPLDYGRKLFLESQGKLRLRDFPVVLARYTNWGTRRPSIRWENETHSFLGFEFPPPDDLLFLRNQGDGKGWILFESHLLKKIDELDVEYVVVGPHLYFLAEYFQASDTFASVASFRDGRDQIFKVEREALPAPHDVFVGNRNQTHSWIALLTRRLGFPENTAEALRSGKLPPGFQRAVPFGMR